MNASSKREPADEPRGHEATPARSGLAGAASLDDLVRAWSALYEIETAPVASPEMTAEQGKHEMVVASDPFSRSLDWRATLHALASVTSKLLVIAVPNAHHWSLAVRSWARARSASDGGAGPLPTRALAPELWAIGRVREHEYYDCPAIAPRSGRDGATALAAVTKGVARLLPRLARMHAFAIDVRPRTPQARRRLGPVSAP